MAVAVDRARDPVRPGQLVQLAAVARRYYLQGRSKVEIAEELGINRFKIARMIEEASERGLVHIEINMPASLDAELSEQLRDAYGLRQAFVVDTTDEPPDSMHADLSRVAADVLSEIVKEGDVVGLSWGRTLNAMANSLGQLPTCSVVQLTGALSGAGVGDTSIELVRRVSEISGGLAHSIYAPMILSDASTARALRVQPHIAEVTSWYDRLTLAIIPVGSWTPPDSQLYNALSNQERQELYDLGVCADTCAVMLSAGGELIRTPFNDRVIGITGDQLRRIPEVVAVAGGRTKTDAIATVLRAGFVTILVTDAGTARHLLSARSTPAAAAQGD